MSSPTGPALQLEGGSFVKSCNSLLMRLSAMETAAHPNEFKN
jgi:hypothetical protein